MKKQYILTGIKWIEDKKDYEQTYIICEYWHDALTTIEDMQSKGYEVKLFEGEQLPLS